MCLRTFTRVANSAYIARLLCPTFTEVALRLARGDVRVM